MIFRKALREHSGRPSGGEEFSARRLFLTLDRVASVSHSPLRFPDLSRLGGRTCDVRRISRDPRGRCVLANIGPLG